MNRGVASSAEESIRRYGEAGAHDDFEAMELLRHPDWQEVWPQSGEIVTSSAAYRAVRTQRPEGAPRVEPRRIGGSGECWWSERRIADLRFDNSLADPVAVGLGSHHELAGDAADDPLALEATAGMAFTAPPSVRHEVSAPAGASLITLLAPGGFDACLAALASLTPAQTEDSDFLAELGRRYDIWVD